MSTPERRELAPSDRTASPPPRPLDAIDLGRGAWIAKSAAAFTFSRSGGPGGQNVNKVNSRADLRVAIDAIHGLSDVARSRLLEMAGSKLVGRDGGGSLLFTSDESRSQLENREACLARLRSLVTAAATIPKKRKKTKPTRGSRERRLDSKRRAGEKKRQRGERFE